MFFGKALTTAVAALTLITSVFTPLGNKTMRDIGKIPNGETTEITEIEEEKVIVTEEEAQEKASELSALRRKYLPSIICFGDSLTYGAGGNGTTYPKTLENLIKENITEKYDLKKIMNASDESDVDWTKFTTSKVGVINYGIGGERSDTICGRAGVIPFTVKGFTVPAEGGKIPVEFEEKDGQKVMPLLQGDGGVNPVTLGDLRGTLSFEYINDDGNVQYYFTPTKVFEEYVFADGTEMICSASEKYKDSLMVIMMGGNGGHNTLDELIEQYRKMLTRQESNAERYIILGYHGTLGALTRYPDVEERFKAEFGDHYISLADYFFSEDALNDAGIEITDEIRAEFESGKCPTVFLSDAVHFNATGYELIGKLIYERMDALGYFDEVKTAYCLD